MRPETIKAIHDADVVIEKVSTALRAAAAPEEWQTVREPFLLRFARRIHVPGVG